MANYDELTRYLKSRSEDDFFLSYSDIEKIIGDKIPNVYIKKRTFTHSNSRFQMYAQKAGFVLTDVDYDKQLLRFERKAAPQKHVSKRISDVSSRAKDPNDIGKDLEKAVEYFKQNWRTTGKDPQYLSFMDKYNSLHDVYLNAGKEAYRASTRIRQELFPADMTNSKRQELKKQSIEYLAKEFESILCQRVDYNGFCDWEHKVATNIRNMYRNNGVVLYTYGTAQKLINVAIKYVLSSNLIDYHHEFFKNCFLPIDGIIQRVLKTHLSVDYLHENGINVGHQPSWSRCDNWDDILDYQNRAREAILRNGYYSPIIWEATHWEIENI